MNPRKVILHTFKLQRLISRNNINLNISNIMEIIINKIIDRCHLEIFKFQKRKKNTFKIDKPNFRKKSIAILILV